MKLLSSILISFTLILVLFFVMLQVEFSIERIDGKLGVYNDCRYRERSFGRLC